MSPLLLIKESEQESAPSIDSEANKQRRGKEESREELGRMARPNKRTR
jgi:hypothetical protein